MPSIPGIRRSDSTAENSPSSSLRTASSAFAAVSTRNPLRRSAVSSAVCIWMSSSTTSNRLTRNLHVVSGIFQSDPERRTLRRRRHTDRAIVAFDDALYYGQTEATAFPMRREHRVENSRDNVFLNSRTVVFYKH